MVLSAMLPRISSSAGEPAHVPVASKALALLLPLCRAIRDFQEPCRSRGPTAAIPTRLSCLPAGSSCLGHWLFGQGRLTYYTISFPLP